MVFLLFETFPQFPNVPSGNCFKIIKITTTLSFLFLKFSVEGIYYNIVAGNECTRAHTIKFKSYSYLFMKF